MVTETFRLYPNTRDPLWLHMLYIIIVIVLFLLLILAIVDAWRKWIPQLFNGKLPKKQIIWMECILIMKNKKNVYFYLTKEFILKKSKKAWLDMREWRRSCSIKYQFEFTAHTRPGNRPLVTHSIYCSSVSNWKSLQLLN